jgi:predicted O-methyltransferase YrrM
MSNSNQLIASEDVIDSLYKHLLKRSPEDVERSFWVERLENTSFEEVMHSFMSCEEYIKINGMDLPHSPGHFYSPVVDLSAINTGKLDKSELDAKAMDLIGLCPDRMLHFWESHKEIILSDSFSPERTSSARYYYNNPVFCRADASVLRAMLIINKPKNIIEIGSGFSSAVMLDTIDEQKLDVDSVTFIDPYPDRLKSLLTHQTDISVTILDKPVQDVDVLQFKCLRNGDFLFIDSSHVLKTQSDVCYELFDVLPSLHPGVIIHFHDIFHPFEYPADWIINRRYSWNELYALRAFLMHNKDYEIIFFNNYFFRTFFDPPCDSMGFYKETPGGSIWLRKIK